MQKNKIYFFNSVRGDARSTSLPKFIIPKFLLKSQGDVFATHQVGAWKSKGGGPRYYDIHYNENGIVESYKEVWVKKADAVVRAYKKREINRMGG